MMLSDQALDVLRRTSLFAGFSEEQLEVVPKVALPKTFAPGATIVTEGEEGAQSLWLIVEGEVEIRVGGELLRVDGPGTHVGEMALLTDAPRSADVVARSETTALQLKRSHLHGLIHSNPEVGIAMLGELARRLRQLNEVVAELMRSDAGTAAAAGAHGLSEPDPGAEHLGTIEQVRASGEGN